MSQELRPNGSPDTLTLSSPVFNLQQRPHAIDKDMAALSAAVYDPAQREVGAWRRLEANELLAVGIEPTNLEDPRSGFRAGVFHNPDSPGQTHALAMAGTDMTSVRDWMTNLGQGLGLDTAQYNEAVCVAKDCEKAFGQDLILTGHSLGGGLAAAAAVAVDAPAVTFNAAGVADATLRREGFDPKAERAAVEDGQIRRYAVDGEVLTTLQNHTPLPKPLGYSITLPDPAPQHGISSFIPGSSMFHSLSLHSMTSVNEAMDKDWRVTMAVADAKPERGPNHLAAQAWLADPQKAAQQHPALQGEMAKASHAVAQGLAALRERGAGDAALATMRQALSKRAANDLEHGHSIQLRAIAQARPASTRNTELEREA